MNKYQVYNFLVLALFLGTSCHAMEPENSQKAIQQIGVSKIDSKQMAIRYGEPGILAYTIRQVFEKYKLNEKSLNKIIEFIFEEVPDYLKVQRKFADAGAYKGCFFALHPYKTEAVIYTDNAVFLNTQTFDLHKLFTHEQKFSKAYCVAYDPHGTKIATCPGDTIYVYDLTLKKFALVQKMSESYDSMTELLFNHDGNKLIISCGSQGVVTRPLQILDLATKAISTKAFGCYMHKIVRCPDGKTFASTDSKYIVLWNLEDQRMKRLSGLEGMWCYCLAFNFDGSQLAAGRQDGNINIWDLKNGTGIVLECPSKKYSKSWIVKPGPKLSLAYGPEDTLWSVSQEFPQDPYSVKIDMHDLETDAINSMGRPDGKIQASCFSDDGSKLAQIVHDEEGNVYFSCMYLLPKEFYSIEELAVMQRLYNS